MRALLNSFNAPAPSCASLPQLRDALLAIHPLDVEFIKSVNMAEAQCWRNMEGERIEWSDKVLGFECGGQQWVNEVCFKAGENGKVNGADLLYVQELLELITTQVFTNSVSYTKTVEVT
jgi:L-galactono-1,4-lactone dehydrogenase